MNSVSRSSSIRRVLAVIALAACAGDPIAPPAAASVVVDRAHVTGPSIGLSIGVPSPTTVKVGVSHAFPVVVDLSQADTETVASLDVRLISASIPSGHPLHFDSVTVNVAGWTAFANQLDDSTLAVAAFSADRLGQSGPVVTAYYTSTEPRTTTLKLRAIVVGTEDGRNITNLVRPISPVTVFSSRR
jgi:hypothetical protein